MKRILFAIVVAMMAMPGIAQHHHAGGRGPQPRPGHHEPSHEARYVEPATNEQVAMVLQVLDNQSFDDKRLEIAKLSVVLAPFRVRDLAQMASRFSFEDRKKEFLIFAYPYCADPENYYDLIDLFSFRSDFDEMMRTVRSR